MPEPEEVIRQFRAGTLSPEAAAEQLLPSLKAAGKLELDLTEDDMAVLEALRRLTRPRLPTAQPLSWESKVWRALGGLPDAFWPQLCQHGLDKIPQCLNYVFIVGSETAADALTRQIQAGSDHAVSTQLPDSFEQYHGRLFGQVPARLVTYADLVNWAGWLQALEPVEDAALERLHLSNPPGSGESPA